MSTKEEQMKKKLEEEKRLQKKLDMELEEAKAQKALEDAAQQEALLKPLPDNDEEECTIKPIYIENDDWKKILEDYKKKYPEYPNPKRNNVLSFPSREATIDFFTAQATAEPPRKFFVVECDPTANRRGDFALFSCGTGKIYTGSFHNIYQQLEADQKANPDDVNLKEGLESVRKALNSSQTFKAVLSQEREQLKAGAPKNEPDQEEQNRSAHGPAVGS